MKNDHLARIETTYTTIDKGFENALAKCSTDEERETLVASRDAARDAFWAAVSANLEAESPFVTKLSADLDKANKKLERSLANLANVSAAIRAMEEAVRLAAALAALAAA